MRKYYSDDNGYIERSQWQHGFWLSVTRPDEDDTHFILDKLHVPPMFLEYLGDPEELPRVEREDDWLMLILLIPVECTEEADMPFKTVPFGIITRGDGILITLCYHDNVIVEDFVKLSRKKCIRTVNKADFTLRIFYQTAFWYLHYLKTLTRDVVGAEKDLRRSVRNDDLIRLMHLQKSLVFFNTAIKGNVMLLGRVRTLFGDTVDTDLLEDVDIELRQADSTVGIYSDILENTLDAYASIISNNVNGVMKRMTGLTIILMVPTFVASLYGMNVDILIGDNRFAFWIIIFIAAVLTAAAFIWLRKIKWI